MMHTFLTATKSLIHHQKPSSLRQAFKKSFKKQISDRASIALAYTRKIID